MSVLHRLEEYSQWDAMAELLIFPTQGKTVLRQMYMESFPSTRKRRFSSARTKVATLETEGAP
jgi:hypothetical protein